MDVLEEPVYCQSVPENVCLSTDEDCQMYAVGSKVRISVNYDLIFCFVHLSGPYRSVR